MSLRRSIPFDRRLRTLLPAAAAAVVLSGGPAVAEPAPFESLEMTCPGLGQIRTVSPGNADLTPSFISGTNELILTYSVTYTIWVDGDLRITGGSDRGNGIPDDAITCSFDETFGLGGHIYHQVGSVTGRIVGEPIP